MADRFSFLPPARRALQTAAVGARPQRPGFIESLVGTAGRTYLGRKEREAGQEFEAGERAKERRSRERIAAGRGWKDMTPSERVESAYQYVARRDKLGSWSQERVEGEVSSYIEAQNRVAAGKTPFPEREPPPPPEEKPGFLSRLFSGGQDIPASVRGLSSLQSPTSVAAPITAPRTAAPPTAPGIPGLGGAAIPAGIAPAAATLPSLAPPAGAPLPSGILPAPTPALAPSIELNDTQRTQIQGTINQLKQGGRDVQYIQDKLREKGVTDFSQFTF